MNIKIWKEVKSGGKSCRAMSWHFAFILFFSIEENELEFFKDGFD